MSRPAPASLRHGREPAGPAGLSPIPSARPSQRGFAGQPPGELVEARLPIKVAAPGLRPEEAAKTTWAQVKTRWTYDTEGRVTNKVYTGSVTNLVYAYDANGRLTNRWSTAKGTTEYRYDANGNLTVVNYPTSPDPAFSYDALNRVTNMVDASGTNRYTYHANGQLLTEDGPLTYDTVTYAYNDGRLRQSLAVQYANNTSWTQTYPNSYVRYAYDAAGQLTWAKATNSSGQRQSGGAGSCRSPHSCRSLLRAGCPRAGRLASDGAWRCAAGPAAGRS